MKEKLKTYLLKPLTVVLIFAMLASPSFANMPVPERKSGLFSQIPVRLWIFAFCDSVRYNISDYIKSFR